MEAKIEVRCHCPTLKPLEAVLVIIEGESHSGQVVGLSRDGVYVGFRNGIGEYCKVWVEKDNVTRYE